MLLLGYAHAADSLLEVSIVSICRFTSIEFLLPSGKYSSMHRLDAPEVWYHHSGSTLQITEIEPSGAVHQTQLGPDPGQQLQHLVPPGRWFGARLSKPSPGSYALVGCAVAPGFDWQGFEMGSRADLCKLFPHATEEIHALTAPT